jgi:uncharacterized protein (TIGR00725 family)
MPIIIGVMGGSSCTPREYDLALEVGKRIAARGWVLLCGGGTGVMEAAARGAKEAGGLTLGILPGSDAEETPPNPHIALPIFTGMSDGRNAINVKSSDVVIAIGGGFGTLSEIALALRCGKPVIGLNTWTFAREGADMGLFIKAETVEEVERLLERALPKRK